MSLDPFVFQLADLCRAHPTRAKWVFVPTHSIGLTLGDRLAREGCDWANLRFVTPYDIAVRMAAPFLLERGIDPSEDPLGPPLVMRLLLGLPAEAGYFRPMADHTSMAAALWRTLRELRFAGIRAADLTNATFESELKRAELIALLEAYEGYLKTARVADMAVVFEEAPAHPSFCTIQATDLWIEMPDTIWPPVVRAFLDRLPGERITPRALEIQGLEVPRRMMALAAPASREPSDAASDAARLRFLRAPASAPTPPRQDGSLKIVHAGGHDAEVEEIIRSVMGSDRRLDEVEIICASDTLLLTAWEKARRLDWPVTLSTGLPAAMTRPGRALLGWGEWVEESFAASVLRRLLQSEDITLDQALPDQKRVSLAPGLAARLLLKAGATWGRHTYTAALTAYAEEQDRRAGDEGDDGGWRSLRAEQCRWLAAWSQGLLDAVPEEDAQGMVAVSQVLDAAAAFLARHASCASETDHTALKAVTEAIDGLRALGAASTPLTIAIRFLTEAVGALRVGRSRPKPGHLHVSTLGDASVDARPLVFVCGLEEAQVFPAAVEDPVLLDAERRSLEKAGAPLQASGDRIMESVFSVVSTLARLATTAARITLSFSCVDTRDFRETFPSWLILQAWRLKTGKLTATYEELRAELKEPASVVPTGPAEAPTTSAWWLCASRIGEHAIPAIARAYPFVARGRVAEAQRVSEAFTEFDGFVPGAGPELDPSRQNRSVSPTLLENAATCFFRFFLERGLGIDPIEEEEVDADVWLNPPTRGSELHDLYAALMRRARDAGRRVSRQHDLEWFLALGRARLEELMREMPPPSEEVHAAESAEFLDDLRTFVEAEEEHTDLEPVAFEVGFGRPPRTEAEPLAQTEPVVFTLGKGRRLLLAGRIDRVDRTGASAYQVMDYKTGRYYADDYRGTFAKGRLLQHALYGVAAEALLTPVDKGARVARGVYWYPTGRGYGRRKVIPAPARTALASVLLQLTDVIGHGLFIQAPEKGACRLCPFTAACGAVPWEAAAAKVDANANGRLVPWIALQEVP